MNHHAW